MRTDKRGRLICAGGSHPGLVRDNNEDLFYCDPKDGIFIVIDGVGGHCAGETAAEIALKILSSWLKGSAGGTEEKLREAITLANNEIYNQAQANSAWSGMSCVLTATIVKGDEVTVGHVGDTRLYLIQPGHITQITRDHSFVDELVVGGFLNEEEAMRHPRRNEITRGLGSSLRRPEDPDFVEISKHPFPPSSALLLCSDGLSDLVSPEQILSVVTEFFNSPSEVVSRLIDAANVAGGKDNVTVIYVAAAGRSVTE